MKQEPISCRADNALAARCQSFAARWACVLKRPIFYLAAYIDNNGRVMSAKSSAVGAVYADANDSGFSGYFVQCGVALVSDVWSEDQMRPSPTFREILAGETCFTFLG